MYDLVIRRGTIYDGTGASPFEGDLAIDGGRIVAISPTGETGGEIGRGREEIDARDRLVTPGFVDVHTHYDGQAMWEDRLQPSSSHGVTTVVAGNCGVGFAPCRPDQHEMLVTVMEGVEDIPEIVMSEGLPWNWESFPEYLDALAARRLDIDIAAQLPHSALRVYVMGERGARREPATAADLHEMHRLAVEALRAGALGVTTSRNLLHRTKAGELAPSLEAGEAELLTLARALKDAGTGVFQLIPEIFGDAEAEFDVIAKIAAASGRPLSFTLLQSPVGDPDDWRRTLDLIDESAAKGLQIRAQIFPRPVGVLYGLDLSFHPFALHPSFRPLADLPLAERVQAMRDPDLRRRLLAEAPEDTNPVYLRLVDGFRYTYPFGDPPCYDPAPETRLDRAAERAGLSVPEYAYDLLLENEGRAIFYQPGANYRGLNLDVVRAMVAHERTVVALGDGGAHYGMICDASYPTYFLERLVRDAKPGEGFDLAWAVAQLTSAPASLVGLNDRGRLAPGLRADLNVIDLQGLRLHTPSIGHDLPAGGRRLRQGADGYAATIVAGEVTYRHGVATGALPGRLVRGARGRPH